MVGTKIHNYSRFIYQDYKTKIYTTLITKYYRINSVKSNLSLLNFNQYRFDFPEFKTIPILKITKLTVSTIKANFANQSRTRNYDMLVVSTPHPATDCSMLKPTLPRRSGNKIK